MSDTSRDPSVHTQKQSHTQLKLSLCAKMPVPAYQSALFDTNFQAQFAALGAHVALHNTIDKIAFAG